MKKITTILVLVFAFTITINAQQQKRGKLSVDNVMQKMTKDLELSADQQSKIKPLIEAQLENRKVIMAERKKLRESGQRPSKKEMEKIRIVRASKEKEMDAKMEAILTKQQFLKYEKMKEKQNKKRLEKRRA